MSSMRLSVVLIVFALAALLGVGYNSYRTNLNSLQTLNEENIAWSSSRLQNRRFDILWSRLALSERGIVGARLRAYDSKTDIMARMMQALVEEEEAVLGLNANNPGEYERLFRKFAGFRGDLNRFSQTVFLGEQERIERARAELRRNAFFIASINIGAFLIGKRMAQINLQLAEDARRATEAKSRFLTMMSHELRTPMNGVLAKRADPD